MPREVGRYMTGTDEDISDLRALIEEATQNLPDYERKISACDDALQALDRIGEHGGMLDAAFSALRQFRSIFVSSQRDGEQTIESARNRIREFEQTDRDNFRYSDRRPLTAKAEPGGAHKVYR